MGDAMGRSSGAEVDRRPHALQGRCSNVRTVTLEPELQDTPENIAKAWEEEVARRINEMDAGLTESVPYEQVRAELREMIAAHRGR
jgi:hypothetical protein